MDEASIVDRYRTILNTVSEAIFLHEADTGRVVEVNEASVQMYGYSAEQFRALSIGELSAGITPYAQTDALARVQQAQAGEAQRFEWRARRSNGELFWVEVNLQRMKIGEQDFLLAVVEDISGRKYDQEEMDRQLRDLVALNLKLEDAHMQLLQSEKLASIGQLAAGVAHEINNPVGYVFSNIGSLEKYLQDFCAMLDAYQQAEPALSETARATVQQLRAELDLDFLRQDVIALLAETREGINRVRKIVQDLKDFSHVGAEDDWQWLDLHDGLDSTLNIVWNELKYKTTFNKEYGQLPRIHGLPSQLNQVFMNLLVNAAHAIEKQGVVTLRTGQQNDEVWVEVQDTGCGIPPDNLKRIFDPFFTTKEVGKGTGLGLSVSYSIVQKHHGRIEVRSEVGKGTVFRVWLPVEPRPAEALPASQS
jgi:PAS domain S-box-containing protein